jgi:hypothetical protein
MFSISSHHRYYLYGGVADMRCTFDGLSGLVRQYMKRDPLSGDVYIFVNRRRNQIRLLVWDRSGFVLYAKRLERGTFELPHQMEGAPSRAVGWEELVMILEGVSLRSIQRRKRFLVFVDKNKGVGRISLAECGVSCAYESTSGTT